MWNFQYPNVDAARSGDLEHASFGETDFDGFLDQPISIFTRLLEILTLRSLRKAAIRAVTVWQEMAGSSAIMNIGDKPILSDQGILTAVAWRTNGQRITRSMVINRQRWSSGLLTILVLRNLLPTDALAASAYSADKT